MKTVDLCSKSADKVVWRGKAWKSSCDLMAHMRGWLFAGLWAGTRCAQEPPRGRIVEDMKCAAAPSQGYALYLPSSYSPDRVWPLILAFDPRARGKSPVERFQVAAETYGYIVAGSNNSRNGAWEASSDPSTR